MRISDWSSDVCSSDLLVLGELDLLFATEPVPQLRAIERHPLGLHEELVRLGGRVPVNVDLGVVGVSRGGRQEALGNGVRLDGVPARVPCSVLGDGHGKDCPSLTVTLSNG